MQANCWFAGNRSIKIEGARTVRLLAVATIVLQSRSSRYAEQMRLELRFVAERVEVGRIHIQPLFAGFAVGVVLRVR